MAGGAEAIPTSVRDAHPRDFADKLLLAAAGAPSWPSGETDRRRPEAAVEELKGWTLTAKITIDRPAIETKNVVGVLEGSARTPTRLVIGGHYDHLGRGGLDVRIAGALLERHPQRRR